MSLLMAASSRIINVEHLWIVVELEICIMDVCSYHVSMAHPKLDLYL